MSYLQKRKELIPIIIIVLVLGIAGLDLFSKQQNNSVMLNSGKRINPVPISGRANCEIPIPDLSKSKHYKPNFRNKEISN